MKRPPFKLVEHPWPNAPKAIDDLYKRLAIVADIADLECSPITEELLREALKGFWNTMLDVFTDPKQQPSTGVVTLIQKHANEPHRGQGKLGQATGSGEPAKGIWLGHQDKALKFARMAAILKELAHGQWSRLPKTRRSAPPQKIHTILNHLLAEGLVEKSQPKPNKRHTYRITERGLRCAYKI